MLFGEIYQSHDEPAFWPGGLKEALSARLALEGFDFEIERHDGGLEVAVRSCPWHQIMIKSGRAALSEKVSDVICRVENGTWAREFSEGEGEEIGFEGQRRLCRGDGMCRLRFFERDAEKQPSAGSRMVVDEYEQSRSLERRNRLTEKLISDYDTC
jgi:hypothetical protein